MPMTARPRAACRAEFELRGDARAGELQLTTPLGSTAGQARWRPGSAELITAEGTRHFADLDALAQDLFGETLPLTALIDWLRGRPWPGAPSAATAGWLRATRLAHRPVAIRRRLGAGRRVSAHRHVSVRVTTGSAAVSLRAIHDVPAPAKLNLFLHVVGRRADGYHLLQSVFVLIDWADTLHFERRSDGRLQRHDLGTDAAGRRPGLGAARRLQAESGTTLGADISIDKRVPWAAGLGGGSSDAASTLLALNRLWGLQLAARAAARAGRAHRCRRALLRRRRTMPSSRASASA